MEQQTRPGDAGRITREYIDSLLVEMRHIDSALASTELTLYGRTFSTPVMTAATMTCTACPCAPKRWPS